MSLYPDSTATSDPQGGDGNMGLGAPMPHAQGLTPMDGLSPTAMSFTSGQASYAHGGHLTHPTLKGGRPKNMIKVHMNPHELDALDWLQGKRIEHGESRIPMYPGIEALIKNPHIRAQVHDLVHEKRGREKHAQGGGVGHGLAPVEASHGRHGDLSVALIGPHTRRFFDSLHTPHRNPIDGAPEYWSLSDMLGGLVHKIGGIGSSIVNSIPGVGNAISGLASQALPMLGQVAQNALPALADAGGTALGSMFGAPEAGGAIGGVLNNLGQSALSSVMPQGQPQNQHAQAIGQGLGTAGQMYAQGNRNARQIAGGAMSSAGSQYQNPYGRAMQGFGQAYGSGQSGMQSAMHGANQGLNSWAQQQQQMPQQYQQPQYQMPPPQQQQEPWMGGVEQQHDAGGSVSHLSPMRQQLMERMRQRSAQLNHANTVQGNAPHMSHGGHLHPAYRQLRGY